VDCSRPAMVGHTSRANVDLWWKLTHVDRSNAEGETSLTGSGRQVNLQAEGAASTLVYLL
jgi:hypothetical protein